MVLPSFLGTCPLLLTTFLHLFLLWLHHLLWFLLLTDFPDFLFYHAKTLTVYCDYRGIASRLRVRPGFRRDKKKSAQKVYGAPRVSLRVTSSRLTSCALAMLICWRCSRYPWENHLYMVNDLINLIAVITYICYHQYMVDIWLILDCQPYCAISNY